MQTQCEMPIVNEVVNRFVLHWGEMARNWGISKTVGQIHALLYVSGHKWTADEIMEELSISRGNVSMSLKELVHWGLVYRVHRRGERKEYFLAELDVWEIFNRIIAERKRREIDPTMATLAECSGMLEAAEDEPGAKEVLGRIEKLEEFFQAMDAFHERFTPRSKADVEKVARLVKIEVEGL